MKTQNYADRLVIEHCIKCGVTFGITEHFHRMRTNDHRSFKCPNGHSQYYCGKSDAEKLKDQLDQEAARRRNAEIREIQAADERDTALRQRAAARGQVTKLKNKIARGQCPCCNQVFKNLESHMTAMHPEYQPDETADE